MIQASCQPCAGTGRVATLTGLDRCATCGGSGRVKETPRSRFARYGARVTATIAGLLIAVPVYAASPTYNPPLAPFSAVPSVPTCSNGDGTYSPCSSSQGQPASAYTETDLSNTISVGGTPQLLHPSAVANGARVGLCVQNQSIGDLWIDWLRGTATASQPSKLLPSLANFCFPIPPKGAVWVYGGLTGQAYQANQWVSP